MKGLFVTGTDTGCGKTAISLALMAASQARGLRVVGMKPIASGCDQTPVGLRNDDALRLQAQASHQLDYRLVNPYTFAPPIAPHIAASEAGVKVELGTIEETYRLLAASSDLVIVEGVGGWRVPLAPELFVSDIPGRLNLPVVLVVGIKLGCLNHALLTAEAIQANGNHLLGWVGNQVDPEMAARDHNLATLRELIQAPCLGIVPWQELPSSAQIAEHLVPLPH